VFEMKLFEPENCADQEKQE